MKLGIIGAMELEVETLLSIMDDKKESSHAGSIFYEGILNGTPAVVVQCGIGKVNAAICTQLLCDCFHVTHLVNTGIAGSLCADLDIGDLVISQDAMYHDFDIRYFGYDMGEVPGMGVKAFPADKALLDYAFSAAEKVHPGHVKLGRVASGDQFVSDNGIKNKIIQNTGALCTEMEGTAIAQTAHRNQVPFVIIRAISDKADNSAEMDYPTFEREAAHHCAEVTETLARMLQEVSQA